MSRFSSLYHDTIVPELMKKFGYKTVMQVPRITKITLNMGVGEAVNDKKNIEFAVGDMTKIAGQKPMVTRTRKAIANFKIRETCRSAAWSPSVANACTTSLIVSLRSPSRASATSAACLVVLLTPRQLQHRPQGTDHLPGNRIRQDRFDPRHEHLHHHDG